MRDDGAGHSKTGTLYAHGDVVSDMLAELDEIRDRVSDAEMAGIVEVMSETLFKQGDTASAATSPSLSRRRVRSPRCPSTSRLRRAALR